MRRVLAGLAAVAMVAGCTVPVKGPKVDAPGKLPDAAAATQPDRAYNTRVLSSYAAAQAFQGPLQGGWTLSAEPGGDLYEFQLSAKGDAWEGAWRDLRAGHDPKASGLLEMAARTPEGLSLRFTPAGQSQVQVTLHPDLHGDLAQGDQHTAVSLRKLTP